tara:strand:- start:755 stop:1243 length:489 start_codon:yes stop_codon:yes gene_type:complete
MGTKKEEGGHSPYEPYKPAPSGPYTPAPKRNELMIADISGFPTTKGLFVDGEGNVFRNVGGTLIKVGTPNGYDRGVHGDIIPSGRASASSRDNLKIASLADGQADSSIMNYVTEKGFFLDGQGKGYMQQGGKFYDAGEYNPDVHGLPVPLAKNRKKLKIGKA